MHMTVTGHFSNSLCLFPATLPLECLPSLLLQQHTLFLCTTELEGPIGAETFCQDIEHCIHPCHVHIHVCMTSRVIMSMQKGKPVSTRHACAQSPDTTAA